ncbi:MAG: ribonuclease HII [Alphaproteobacteria bacterium]|nr:ribonuclease HII [Alphaproteobacteria bacterium]
MRILGLDEAGRGSVLGPLVVGAFCVLERDLHRLQALGVTDSKRLSAARREAMIEPLGALGEARVHRIPPAEIDEGNLNTLEERAFLRFIQELRPDRVIIDAPCNPKAIPRFVARLQAALDFTPAWVVEPKADLNHLPCGAASIFAKVRRDQAIAALGARAEIGSGYPSDPRTRAWIKGFLDRGEPLPPAVRQRWGTVSSLSQQSLF